MLSPMEAFLAKRRAAQQSGGMRIQPIGQQAGFSASPVTQPVSVAPRVSPDYSAFYGDPAGYGAPSAPSGWDPDPVQSVSPVQPAMPSQQASFSPVSPEMMSSVGRQYGGAGSASDMAASLIRQKQLGGGGSVGPSMSIQPVASGSVSPLERAVAAQKMKRTAPVQTGASMIRQPSSGGSIY